MNGQGCGDRQNIRPNTISIPSIAAWQKADNLATLREDLHMAEAVFQIFHTGIARVIG